MKKNGQLALMPVMESVLAVAIVIIFLSKHGLCVMAHPRSMHCMALREMAGSIEKQEQQAGAKVWRYNERVVRSCGRDLWK